MENTETKELLTWDEIYVLADGCACGEEGLNRKDTARWAVHEYALEHGLPDPEEDEIPEESIEWLCDKFGIMFDANGNISEVAA